VTMSSEFVKGQNEPCVEHEQHEHRSNGTKHDITYGLVDVVVGRTEHVRLPGPPARPDLSTSDCFLVSLTLCKLRCVVHDRQHKNNDSSDSGSSKTGRRTSPFSTSRVTLRSDVEYVFITNRVAEAGTCVTTKSFRGPRARRRLRSLASNG